MKLLTKELEKRLPAIYAQDGFKEYDAKVYAKFFDPCSNWTWYVMEGEKQGNDFIFFGLVQGFELELGYFSLNELSRFKNKFNLGIERDRSFTTKSLAEVKRKIAEIR